MRDIDKFLGVLWENRKLIDISYSIQIDLEKNWTKKKSNQKCKNQNQNQNRIYLRQVWGV